MKKMYIPMDIKIRILDAELDCFQKSGDLMDDNETGGWYPGW